MRHEHDDNAARSRRSRRLAVAVPLLWAAAALIASPLLAADAPLVPLQVESTTLSAQSLMLNRAIDELKAEPNYTWTSTATFSDPMPRTAGAKPLHNFVYPAAHGVTDSTGLSAWVEAATAAGATHEFIVQGQAAIARIQGEWKAADAELMRDRMHYADLPGDAVALMRSVLNLQRNDDGSFSGTLTDKAASDLLMTGRVQPPKLLLAGEVALPGLQDVINRYGVPKATAQFDVTNGVLVKETVKLGFAKTADGVAQKTSWTQTIAFTELGSTTISIPDDARKLLGTIAPAAVEAPVASAAPGVSPADSATANDYRTRGSRDRRGSFGFERGSSNADRSGEPPIALPPGFEVLAHKSIFEKDRTRWIPPGERHDDLVPVQPYRAPAVPPPQIPILVGVILGDTDYIAYVEDPDSGKIWPVGVGDPLPQDFGSVDKVTFNSIEIAKDGASPRQIVVGQTLKGDLPPAASVLIPSTAAATSGTPAAPEPPLPAVDVNDPAAMANLTAEQRMKLRRIQQLGQSQ